MPKACSGDTESNSAVVRAYIALGSNVGKPSVNIAQALELLNQNGIKLTKKSSIITTAPLAGFDQPDYANAVAEIETKLSPLELLDRVKRIESALGRIASPRWSSRIIDLDIIFYGDQIIDEENLKIPHRQMHLRDFVLRPLAEIAPDFVHPILGVTVEKLHERLNGSDFFLDPKAPQLVTIAGVIGVGKTTLASGIAEKLNGSIICEEYDKNPYLPKVYDGHFEYALDSELFFTKSSVSQLGKDSLKGGKVYIADYMFEKALIYANFWLNSSVFEQYLKEYNVLKEKVAQPRLVIHVTDSTDQCLERIKKRNRPYEQDITADVLDKLGVEYDKLLKYWDKSPVIEFDAGENDFRDPGVVAELAKQVKEYIVV